MTLSHLRSEIQEASGQTPRHRPDAAATFKLASRHPVLAEYLATCVCDKSWEVAGSTVYGFSKLVEENLEKKSPGRFIYPQGFLVFATADLGEVLTVDADTGIVYRLSAEDFRDDVDYTPALVRQAGGERDDGLEQAFAALFDMD